jgi:riboflavin kinase / FMN adenylyltransferase
LQVEEELASFSPDRDTILTIGVFDGVHLGHQKLIEELTRQARQRNMLSGVVTFRQHPEDLFSTGKKLPFLTDIKTRTKLLKEEGVDFIVTLSFTKELASLSARQFITLLKQHLRVCGLVIGLDFALGKSREGDTAAIQKLGQEMGLSVTVVPPLRINGEVVSSTTLRKALAKGNITIVQELTGRPYSLHGKVVEGAGRGEGLGFPTANMDVKSGQALPPDGVYVGLTRVNGKIYQSMTNIGRNPTFGDAERSVESYLVDYHGDLYGKEVYLDIIARLRDEKKFANSDELKKQISQDIVRGKSILESMGVKQQ